MRNTGVLFLATVLSPIVVVFVTLPIMAYPLLFTLGEGGVSPEAIKIMYGVLFVAYHFLVNRMLEPHRMKGWSWFLVHLLESGPLYLFVPVTYVLLMPSVVEWTASVLRGPLEPVGWVYFPSIMFLGPLVLISIAVNAVYLLLFRRRTS